MFVAELVSCSCIYWTDQVTSTCDTSMMRHVNAFGRLGSSDQMMLTLVLTNAVVTFVVVGGGSLLLVDRVFIDCFQRTRGLLHTHTFLRLF